MHASVTVYKAETVRDTARAKGSDYSSRTHTGLWHPACVRALACMCNRTNTVLCHWIHIRKCMCSCVNIAVHPEKTVLFLCGNWSYEILSSMVCIIKNTTEECSFGCESGRESTHYGDTLMWLEKYVCGLRDLCCISHRPPYSLWHFIETASQICNFFLIPTLKAIAALPILEFFVVSQW